MAKKDWTTTILKQMEDGTEEIFARYQALARGVEASYDSEIKRLNEDYRRKANLASARAAVDEKNLLETMADKGYVSSGETVQARVYANAQRAGALSQLARQNADEAARLSAEKGENTAKILAEAQKEADERKTQTLTLGLEQANRDREYEAARQQEAFENRLAEERLRLESDKSGSTSQGIVPEKSAYEYLNEIVKKNTVYNNKEGYKTVDRRAILQSLSSIIRDTKLSYRYRYELYLYGKTMGYISE